MPKAPEPSSTCQKTTKSLPRISPKSYCYNAVPNRFLAHFSTPRTNGPRSLSRVKAGTHSPLLKGSHTAACTPKQGAFRMGVVSLPSERFTRFGNPAWPGVRTAYFAALGSWPGGALEERRKPSGQRCAYACRCSEGVAAPLGFSLLLKLHLCAPLSGLSTLARCGGVTTALGMLCALSKCSVRRFQNGLHLCPHSGVGNIPTFPQRIARNVSHVEGGSFSSEATVASDLPSDFYKYVNCINNSACRFCCNCFCGMVR